MYLEVRLFTMPSSTESLTLCFQFNRGTYTSHGRRFLDFEPGWVLTLGGPQARSRRATEILLRDVEVRESATFVNVCAKYRSQHVATLASLYRFHKGDYAYAKSKIDVCWEKVMLNQREFVRHRFEARLS